ncbi:MAG: MarR family transcriptional regulator [Chloroflexi bacterium]|nr:MarR family transcriptional regulator [Chloroflexota bacterium]
MEKEHDILIRRILDLSRDIFNMIIPGLPREWLAFDITVMQLRVLLMLYTEGPSRMSTIASSIDAALSTATGIVDNLVKKDLVLRESDPQDRRVVICKLSDKGVGIAGGLWTWGEHQMKLLLETMNEDQLHIAEETARYLKNNMVQQINKNAEKINQ